MKHPFALTVIILTVGLAGILFWSASRTLDGSVLLLADSDGIREVVRGWSVVLSLWPVLLLGAVPALMIIAFLTLCALGAAIDADTTREITRLRQAADEARTRAEKAEQEARARYRERCEQAEQMQQKAAQRIQEAEARENAARDVIIRARQEVIRITELAKRQTEDAQRRQHNATGAAERRRRKIEKLTQGNLP